MAFSLPPVFTKKEKHYNMNKQERDVLLALYEEPFINQRITSEQTGHSLGIVNRSIKNLIAEGYLNEMCQVTAMAQTLISTARPQNAIILAAGFGMRMVPINRETPKGLLEVNGQPLIERQIIQLHEAGVQEIYVVAGFMKESFEYLIDKYGVELVVNKEYAAKNNLSSLALVSERLGNTYIVPCDVWCDKMCFMLMRCTHGIWLVILWMMIVMFGSIEKWNLSESIRKMVATQW